jgi:hypothetical protein
MRRTNCEVPHYADISSDLLFSQNPNNLRAPCSRTPSVYVLSLRQGVLDTELHSAESGLHTEILCTMQNDLNSCGSCLNYFETT